MNTQTFGEKACHPERSEGSGSPDAEILRGVYPERSEWAQDDSKTPLKSAHGKPSLQMSRQILQKYTLVLCAFWSHPWQI